MLSNKINVDTLAMGQLVDYPRYLAIFLDNSGGQSINVQCQFTSSQFVFRICLLENTGNSLADQKQVDHQFMLKMR